MNYKYLIFILVIIVACISSVGIDIYAPSIPAVALGFGVKLSMVQFTMVVYLLGVALSQLIYGPLSEVYGRKTPLVVGLLILLVGTIICGLANNIYMLLIGRVIQGLGAGSGKLIGPILKDVFDGKTLARLAAYIHTVVAFVIPAAPAIGGYLQHIYGWRASFVFIFAYGFVALCLIIALLKETSQHHHRDRLKLSFIMNAFKQVIVHPAFLGFSICNLITYGALYSWVTAMPVLYMHVLGMSAKTYGMLVFVLAAAAMFLGSLANTQLIKRVSDQTILRIGWSVMFLTGLFLLIVYLVVGVNPYLIMAAIFVFMFATPLIWAHTFVGAYAPFGHIAGYVGALFAFMQLLGGFVLGSIVSYLPEFNQIPIAVIFMVSAVTCLIVHSKLAVPGLERCKVK